MTPTSRRLFHSFQTLDKPTFLPDFVDGRKENGVGLFLSSPVSASHRDRSPQVT